MEEKENTQVKAFRKHTGVKIQNMHEGIGV